MTPSFSLPLPDVARRAILWTLGAVFLALCIHSNDGRYSVAGMIFLSLCIAAVVWATLMPARANFDARFDSVRALNTVLAASATFFAAFWIAPDNSPNRVLSFGLALAGCALVAVILARLSSFSLLQKSLFPILLALQLIFGVSNLIKAAEWERKTTELKFHVSNDVQVFAHEGARLLVEGKNPYSVKMPNVMGANLPFYAAGATDKDGNLPFGYPYLPLTLLWSLPGYLLGDFRWMHALALSGAAFFLAYARPSVTSQLAASLFLLFPPTRFVLVMSWIEPVALFFLGATVFCAFRAPRWLFLALGCLLASKQYMVFLLPLLPLLVPEKEKWRPLMWQSVAVACALTLPLAFWDVAGFWRSVVAIQFHQPFREDSLSYLVVFLRATGIQLSPLLGFAALFAGLVWGLKRSPRHVAGWCSAGALAYLGFFALNKQAFANYYFWPFGLLLAAVAIALPPSDESAPTA